MGIVYKVNGKLHTRDEFRKGADKSKLKDTLRSRKFPSLNSDTTFMANRGTLADQLGDDVGLVTSEAKKRGYTPNYTDTYLPSLADFPGDPKAFVRQDGARGHVRKVCEDQGWECDGSVTVKPRETEEVDTGLADELVIDSFLEASKKDPKMKFASKEEIRTDINRKHHKK